MLINFGKVGILKNVFRFDMPEQAYRKQGKKMNAPYHHVTDLLNSEKSVSALYTVIRYIHKGIMSHLSMEFNYELKEGH